MEAARRRPIDVLNLSLGVHHDACLGRCRSCKAVDTVVSEGTTVVAAAGNDTSQSGESVYCPGLASRAITVSTLISECTARPGRASEPKGPHTGDYRAPNAHWIRNPDISESTDSEYLTERCFCSYNNCGPGFVCEKNRREFGWEKNPRPSEAKPEVLAPGLQPTIMEVGPAMAIGTSYSAAVVSGALAEILSELYSRGSRPSPYELKIACVEGGQKLQNDPTPKFDALSTYKQLMN